MECQNCGKECIPGSHTPGYGIYYGKILCFDCCSQEDIKLLRAGKPLILYLTKEKDGKYVATNWPGTLRIPVYAVDNRVLNRQAIDGFPMKNIHFEFRFENCHWKGIVRNSDWNQSAVCHPV